MVAWGAPLLLPGVEAVPDEAVPVEAVPDGSAEADDTEHSADAS
jgi:hypothetical protein